MTYIPPTWVNGTAPALNATNLNALVATLAAALPTSDAPELIRDTMGSALVAGVNITITLNDGANTITIAASGAGGGDAGDAKVIYVSATGNDTNSGLVHSEAKLTLAAALTAMGAGTLGRIVMGAGTISAGSGISLSGYACEIIGQGDATVLTATAQTGPVLNFTGYACPGQAGGGAHSRQIGNFHIQGDGAADATKTHKGVKFASNTVNLRVHDISVELTGGAGFDFSGAEICDFERLVVTCPVGANTNDVPFFEGIGALNANVFDRLGFRANDDLIGVSGALVFTDNGIYSPIGGRIQSPWVQGLIVPANGCIFSLKTNTYIFDDLQINDTFRVSGAANTAFIRLGEPAVDDYGGNIITGLIPGDNEGIATSIGVGVVVAQSGNRIDGIKGWQGNNIVINAGVDYTYAILGGCHVGSAAAGIIDNSGTLTNTCFDYVATAGGNI